MAYSEIDVETPLYHYTTLDAFRKIISSGEIRFSRADQTNDRKEVSFVRDFTVGFLNKLIEKQSLEVERANLQGILSAYEKASEPNSYYISCWSKRNDSIAMWRLYAEEGKGVVFRLRDTATSKFVGRLSEIIYLGEQAVVERIDGAITKALNESYGYEHTPVVVRLSEAAYASKEKQWDYENEVRFTFSYIASDYKEIRDIVDNDKVIRTMELVPSDPAVSDGKQFIFQKFGRRKNADYDKSGAISEVILGSRCPSSIEEITAILLDEGFMNFDVRRSEVDWR